MTKAACILHVSNSAAVNCCALGCRGVAGSGSSSEAKDGIWTSSSGWGGTEHICLATLGVGVSSSFKSSGLAIFLA